MDTIVFGTPQPPTSTITPYRSLVRVTVPVVEPVSLAAAKTQCRVDTDSDDDYIVGLLAVARQYVEDILDITLLTTVWEARYDLFPVWSINLPRAPMADGAVTVTYRRGDGTYGTLQSAMETFRSTTASSLVASTRTGPRRGLRLEATKTASRSGIRLATGRTDALCRPSPGTCNFFCARTSTTHASRLSWAA